MKIVEQLVKYILDEGKAVIRSTLHDTNDTVNISNMRLSPAFSHHRRHFVEVLSVVKYEEKIGLFSICTAPRSLALLLVGECEEGRRLGGI